MAGSDVNAGSPISSFHIDLPTLCVMAFFITLVAGFLLLFCWLQNRREPSLALWGLGYVLAAIGSVFLALRGFLPMPWSMMGAGTFMCSAYGLLWTGSRVFEGRAARLPLAFAGGATWLAACQFEIFRDFEPARILLVTVVAAIYTLLCAYEVWNARDRELISRWPTLVLMLLHAGFLLARIPLLPQITFPLPVEGPHQGALLVIVLEALFVVFCLAFLRVNMSKERAELEQRKAAMTDWLTGIANRRAFFAHGEALLRRHAIERSATALVLFDIDRFKEVNDTAGHHAGDAVLRAFAALVNSFLCQGDLFGRLGGEEFACLLPKTSMAQALQLCEEIRAAFAAKRFDFLDGNVTVSVGIAMARDAARGMAREISGEADSELQALLATADRALYRAKAEGRNRVAPTPLTLVDINRDAARRPAQSAV